MVDRQPAVGDADRRRPGPHPAGLPLAARDGRAGRAPPQWIRSGDRATHISGRVNGVPHTGRCSAAKAPPIFSGNRTTSLFSGQKMTPCRSNVRKSAVDARAVAGPCRDTAT